LTETNKDQQELKEEYTGNRLPTKSYKQLVLDDFSRELQNDFRFHIFLIFI